MAALFAGIAGCGQPDTLIVTSPAFEEGDNIPKIHTGVGDNFSPEINWEKVPEGAETFALICEDPDSPGGTFIHWVIYNIPGKQRRLMSAIPTEPELENGILQGQNDFGRSGYAGPNPPPGKAHRYFFILYALNAKLEVDSGLDAAKLRQAMEDHILSEGRIMGTFAR
jgi:Raf kinase inhibitor-like YbhB/YbcL family protein